MVLLAKAYLLKLSKPPPPDYIGQLKQIPTDVSNLLRDSITLTLDSKSATSGGLAVNAHRKFDALPIIIRHGFIRAKKLVID